MSDGALQVYEPVANRDGWVLYYPQVADNLERYSGGGKPNPYAESIYAKFPIGVVAQRGIDKFVYLKNGASALSTIGTPLQRAASLHAELDDDIVVGAASAIGAYTVTLTSTANLAAAPLSTKDGLKNGYLIVNDVDGEGQLYQIKGHEAASGTSNFVVTLYDPLTIALTTSSQVGLARHPADGVIASAIYAATETSGSFVGVNLLAITASYYFWAQYKGVFPGNANEAIVKGQAVVCGITAAKFNAFDVTSTTQYIVGTALTPAVADTEKFMIYSPP